jgi:hypothetical protein
MRFGVCGGIGQGDDTLYDACFARQHTTSFTRGIAQCVLHDLTRVGFGQA